MRVKMRCVEIRKALAEGSAGAWFFVEVRGGLFLKAVGHGIDD